MVRLFALALIAITFAKPAYAYIDAALGSLVLQSIVAGFFTFMVVWRGWMAKVKAFFGGKKADTLDSTEQE